MVDTSKYFKVLRSTSKHFNIEAYFDIEVGKVPIQERKESADFPGSAWDGPGAGGGMSTAWPFHASGNLTTWLILVYESMYSDILSTS